MPDTFGVPIVVPPSILTPVNAVEIWLSAATDWFRPMVADVGLVIPKNIRYAYAFTSHGRRGKVLGECWSTRASEDGWFRVFVRTDQDETETLTTVLHECLHACLPFGLPRPHSGEFRRAALALGFLPPMKMTPAGPELLEKFAKIAADLGPLPHGRLRFREEPVGGDDTGEPVDRPADGPRLQTNRRLKARCAVCGWNFDITRKQALLYLPPCRDDHGRVVCDGLDDEDGG